MEEGNQVRKTSDTSDNMGRVVAKGVLVTGFGNIGLRFLDLIFSVLLLRWLTLFEFGTYRLVLATYDLFTNFFLTGLEGVVVSDVSRSLGGEPRKARAIFSFYFYFMFLIGLLLWFLFFMGSGFLSFWFEGSGPYLKIISFLFILAPLETAYKLRLQIFLDFTRLTFYKVIVDLARIGIIVASFFFFLFGVKAVLWSLPLSVLAALLIAGVLDRKKSLLLIPSFSEIKDAARHLFLRHGKWALFDDFLMSLGGNIRPFIIKTFVGVEAVALFSTAQSLLAYTTSLFPIRDILAPVLPRSVDPDRLSSQTKRAIKYSVLAHIVLTFGAALGAPLLVLFLFPKYLPSLPLFFIILLSLPWTGFRSVVLPVFYALKEQRMMFRLTIVRLSFTLVFGVVLIYLFGLWGAAVEAMLAGVLITLPFARALYKLLPQWKFSWRDLFIFDEYDKKFLAETKNRLLEKAGLKFSKTSVG